MNATRNEEWRPVPGFEGAYEVSDLGRVRSLDRVVIRSNGSPNSVRSRILKQHVNVQNGYVYVKLRNAGSDPTSAVHRLVALAFLGAPKAGQIVCHNNNDREDPRLSNIRWDTPSANMYDKRRDHTDYNVNKTHCPRGHRLAGMNLREIRSPGRRGCKSCNRATAKYPVSDPRFVAEADRQYRRLSA